MFGEPTTRSLRRTYGAWPCGAPVHLSVEESVTPSYLFCFCALSQAPLSTATRASIVFGEPTARSLRRTYGAWPCGAPVHLSVEESVTPSHFFCSCALSQAPLSTATRTSIVFGEPTARSLRRTYGAWPCGAPVHRSLTEYCWTLSLSSCRFAWRGFPVWGPSMGAQPPGSLLGGAGCAPCRYL